MQKPKIIVILGQTATGKSGFAVEVAKKINGEIIQLTLDKYIKEWTWEQEK